MSVSPPWCRPRCVARPCRSAIRYLEASPWPSKPQRATGWTPPLWSLSLVRMLGSLRLLSLIRRCLFFLNLCCRVAIRRRLPAEWSIPRSRITDWMGGSSGPRSLPSSLWMTLSVTMKAVLWLFTINPAAVSSVRRWFQAWMVRWASCMGSVWLPSKPMSSTHPLRWSSGNARWKLPRMGWRKVLARSGACGHPAATPVVAWNQGLSSPSAKMALCPV